MAKDNALFVGGCPASYHRLEPAILPVLTALEGIGLNGVASGVKHPDGGDAFEGDYRVLSEDVIKDHEVIVLFTTGADERGADIPALINAVRGGKALVGIHCATDSFKNSAGYIDMMGGQFRTHPAPLDIAVEFMDTQHPITRGLKPFTVHDELYLFERYDPSRVHLLAQTTSFDDNGPVPLCWTREEGLGRIFYISLGHFPDVMNDQNWRTLFQRGVLWAMGRDPQEVG